MPRYSDSIGRRARGRERMRTDRRGDDGIVRPMSAGAPCGGEACPEGCGTRIGGHGPASVSGYGSTAAYGAMERGDAFQLRGLFQVVMFNGDFLPILQLSAVSKKQSC
jgi:hypothetical protein